VADQSLVPQHNGFSVDQAIAAWLDAKFKRSRSEKTRKAYCDTVASFRAVLSQFGLDLYGDPVRVSLVAQGWAGQRSEGATREGDIAQATYNQRLAAVSSFFVWAKRSGMYTGENPIDRVERVKVEDYAHAVALEAREVEQLLLSIDRSTLAGLRDYALFCVAILTGWRASAIASMEWGHITIKSSKKETRVIVFSPRLKGGRTGSKELDAGTSAALLAYLHALYGADLGHLDNRAPVWVSLSRNGSRGRQIGVKALEEICKKYTGVSTFHMLRHTHALNMKEAGARDSDIQESLDHASLATTGRYIPKLARGRNVFGRKMESMFGIVVSTE
jgi:integrase